MTPHELLRELAQRHVDVWVDGKLLRYRAHGAALTDTLLSALRRHKTDLIRLLGSDNGKVACGTRLDTPSIGQQALYYLHVFAPQSPAYNVASAARIRSVVDVAAMRQAFGDLISRHDTLRTTFETQDGELKRLVHSDGEVNFRQIDCCDLGETELERIVREEYRKPFDLKSGPLLRVRLFSVSAEDHVFLMTLHHIVFDAWSLWILQDEFRQLYAHHTEGKVASLPDVRSTYSDFVRYQETVLASEHGERLWKYWRERLAGDLTPPDLPLDYARPERPRLQGATCHFRIPGELTTRLREFGKSRGVTPFVVLLTIFNTLLHSYTGQNDLIVGTTTSGRTKADFSQVLGYFVNTLAIRTSITGETEFPDYLAHVKERVLEAMAHQELPFPLIVDRLNPRRDSGRLPICTVMFGMQKPQEFREVARLFGEKPDAIDWGGLKVFPLDLAQQEGQFDVTLEIFDARDSYYATLKYDSQLFRPETAERMAEHYVQLAESIVENPQRPLAEFSLLTEAERRKIDRFSATTPTPELPDCRVDRLFELQADRDCDRVAVILEGEQWSYGRLNRRANQAARWLRDLGLKSGGKVVCRLERSMDVPVFLLAIVKAGGTYVPLDPASPECRSAEVIRDCSPDLVLTHESTLLAEQTGSLSKQHIVVLNGCSCRLDDYSPENLGLDASCDLPAYVIYTSGSTGRPKGVSVSHRAFAEHICCIRETYALTADDRVLQFSNHSFDPSLEQMFAPWSVGATVVLRGNTLWTPDEFWQSVRTQRLTVANVPPAYFRQCSDAYGPSPMAGSLRLFVIGGDRFPVETFRVWEKQSIKILNAYGPTEAVITATTYDATRHDPTSARVPIGRPKRGLHAYVLDDRGRPTPIGVPGELYLGGKTLSDGYLNDKDLTATKFVANPFSADGGRMYRTGDRVRWTSTGDLEFLGRTDTQIKIAGYRVETSEVEHVLNSFPGVRESVVLPRPDRHGDTHLVGWLVSVQACHVDENELRSFVRARLPGYMVPRQFVFLDSLPLMPSGKINTGSLPDPTVVRSNEDSYVGPRTDTERILAQIWAKVLDVDAVSMNDDFFNLGGGSLTSLRIVALANDAGLKLNGRPLPPELLFEYPTVGRLAALLTS